MLRAIVAREMVGLVPPGFENVELPLPGGPGTADEVRCPGGAGGARKVTGDPDNIPGGLDTPGGAGGAMKVTGDPDNIPGGLDTPGEAMVTGGAIFGGPVGAPEREVVSCPLLPRPRAIMSRSSWSGAPV